MPSQAMAYSSAKCKADRPPENFASEQSFTMCDIVCENAPQEHDGSEAWFQQTRLAAHRPWPVQKWFNVDHKRRRRSKPGGAMEGYMINERFTMSEAARSSVHFCLGDTSSCCGSSSHTGRLDEKRTSGWDLMSVVRGRVILLRSWFVAAIRWMWGGVMWLKTGNHGRGVGHRAPETMHMDSFSWTSIPHLLSLLCLLDVLEINQIDDLTTIG